MGVSRAAARIRVSGEEERRGHGQGAGAAEAADATPEDGGQEHHHQRRRHDGRLTCLMQSLSASAALRALGAVASTEGSLPLCCGGSGTPPEKCKADGGGDCAGAVGELCGGGRGE